MFVFNYSCICSLSFGWVIGNLLYFVGVTQLLVSLAYLISINLKLTPYMLLVEMKDPYIKNLLLTTHFCLVLRLRICNSLPLYPQWGFITWFLGIGELSHFIIRPHGIVDIYQPLFFWNILLCFSWDHVKSLLWTTVKLWSRSLWVTLRSDALLVIGKFQDISIMHRMNSAP